MIRGLKKFKLERKRVLVRCDFNVPLGEKGNIEDDYRIKQALPTIEYLLKAGNKIILMSHLGDPEGRVLESLRLDPVQKKLEELLERKVLKTGDCTGKEVEKRVSKMKNGEVLLLENLRFHDGEKKNDAQFAKDLAKLGDFYVNNAFGVCHRSHASVVSLPQYLPSAAGFLLEKEVKVLSRILKNPWRPLVVVIGGAKISSKIRVINKFLDIADHVLVGGKIANDILIAKSICVGRPWPEDEVIKEVEKFQLTSTKLHLPIDVLASPDDSGTVYVRTAAPGKVRNDELLLDIGPETVEIFSMVLKEAKMILWSGPMGLFENPLFAKGTEEVARAIAKNHKAYKIVGGGDTLFAVSKFGLTNKFDHISTGGGAMLGFLSGEDFPGLKPLEE